MPSAENQRIAKNTLFLYFRMGVTIIVNLYAVRVVWQVLGIEDYGIYNVVGGIVLMFQFLNNSMVTSSQRYLSYELGAGGKRLNEVFSISLRVHYILAIFILILAETIGLWFLNYKLNIPIDRMSAANVVYQCSIITFLVTVISVPYNACIVAHEHMKIYGYIGILEVILKLAVIFLLMIMPFDKLITYSLMILIVQLLIRFIYQVYCKVKFPECKYVNYKGSTLQRELLFFAGWSFIGNMGFSIRDQGLNILVNMFFNVTMNAAKGVAFQVTNVIRNFAASFQMALNPQITKLYAAGRVDEMLLLLGRGCKFSLVLVMIISLPLYFEAEFALSLWLGNVNEYMVAFLRLSLFVVIIEAVVGPLVTALLAVGHIRKFQIVICFIMLLNIPFAWVWLKFHLDPYIVMWVTIITSIIGVFVRIILLKEHIKFNVVYFIFRFFIPPIALFALSAILLWYTYPIFPATISGVLCFCAYSLVLMCIFAFIICFTKIERRAILKMIVKRI